MQYLTFALVCLTGIVFAILVHASSQNTLYFRELFLLYTVNLFLFQLASQACWFIMIVHLRNYETIDRSPSYEKTVNDMNTLLIIKQNHKIERIIKYTFWSIFVFLNAYVLIFSTLDVINSCSSRWLNHEGKYEICTDRSKIYCKLTDAVQERVFKYIRIILRFIIIIFEIILFVMLRNALK